MSFCLPFKETQKFLTALKDGTIDPEKVTAMTSAERRAFFESIVGKADAPEVNALYESKLLLKNQQQGLINWAKQLTGIKESVRRDIVSRIEKMDNVLNAKDEETFLNDLASKKIGTDVTFEEAKQITDLSKQLTEAKSKLDPKSPAGSPGRLDYGAKLVALQEYVNGLKSENAKTTLGTVAAEFKTSPFGAVNKLITTIAGSVKGIKASLDNSALFRQGWRTIFTNPKIWAENAVKSFSDIAKQLGNKPSDNAVINGIKAEIYSRPNAVSGLYKDMKLDIGTGEEAYPTSLPEKLPLFGRLYKASETAYQGFLYRMRADIADKYVEIAKNNGVDITEKSQARSFGKLVNSLTGRGDLGSLEKVGKQINTLFFSPKSLKASFDFLTSHLLDDTSLAAKKQAAINILKVVAGTAVILGVAKALNNNSVELDPRSSDFGKIKIGNTRFDVSGGMASIVTLASRLITLSSKSTVTQKVTPINSGKFGAKTGLDVAVDFAASKASPLASVLVDYYGRGKTFSGQKPTVLNEAGNLITPLPISNAMETFADPNSANDLLVILADALGISTNTYSSKKK